MVTKLKAILALSLFAATLSCTDKPKAMRLQFRPTPGERHTMQITVKWVTSFKASSEKLRTTDARYIFGFEPTQVDAKGMAHVKITIQAIQIKSENVTYDSNEPKDATGFFGEQFSRLIMREFTINVSPDGEIVDTGLDELFLGLAEDSITGIDQAIREEFGNGAQKVIEKADAQHGSREKRRLVIKKELEEGSAMPRRQIECLLSDLMCRFPETRVQPGDSWSSSARLYQFIPFDMPVMCRLSTAEQGVCTIEVHGRRKPEDEATVLRLGSGQLEERSSGSYQATLRVDRRTGQLLSRRAQTNLAGEIRELTDGRPHPPMAFETEITTTVETVE